MRPPRVFETERLVLRAPRPDDAQPIFTAFARDPEVTRFLTWRSHPDIQQSEQYVARCMLRWGNHTAFPWAIVLKEKDELAGMIEIRPDRFKAELGYVLARAHWGKGIMTEAARQVTDWAMSQPEIYRVWAVCDVANVASARVLEKAGMRYEGLLRRYMIHPNVGDEPRDCRCYAVVK